MMNGCVYIKTMMGIEGNNSLDSTNFEIYTYFHTGSMGKEENEKV